MKSYIISAKSVGFLSMEIEAKNEEEAYKILNDKLDDGEMPEIDGWIEGKEVEKINL
ncbi:hypothetical protein M0R04_10455 [Candidatus Dojkabacteria bacterium]|jgi:hypothetical protein|nr:hypothetical protein [Candidatus Dojkabacteria bacterium]